MAHGHVEYWKWQDMRTVEIARGEPGSDALKSAKGKQFMNVGPKDSESHFVASAYVPHCLFMTDWIVLCTTRSGNTYHYSSLALS